ncbi:alpha/beta fold hydrolase [Rhodanobacter sp. AS-Z3]|uniref:alpha/beta hydrolase n=1 Tax=Rhodanobacter sp. AS-Z3 TaxID=3031330 RepID=UPI00247AA8E6|nr:alpha/beta fold hydrolase [Rhodanobacter sp. AS-Z3]WEN15201.1 alpha/beta fold hydrolase [Rhodanobacter sp. AS-Z3]
MRIRTLLLTVATLACLYVVSGACLLRFALEPLLLPHVDLSAPATAPLFLRIHNDDGNAMLVRRYGVPKLGCVVFFPGQHGLIPAYQQHLFPAFSTRGIGVLAVSYSGQNGAAGTAHLHELVALAAQVVAAAQAACPGHRVVVYGHSLGSMVAAYAEGRSHPTGLILESTAPSFSSAIRLRLSARWYLAPLTRLPVSRLIAHDYSLTEALSTTLDMPTVVFQGATDSQTPLAELQAAGMPGNLQLVVVPGGTHSTTYLLARNRMLQATLSMLCAQQSQSPCDSDTPLVSGVAR